MHRRYQGGAFCTPLAEIDLKAYACYDIFMISKPNSGKGILAEQQNQ
jgi:hypothetical protein